MTISLGDIGVQIIAWLAATFGTALATVATAWLMKKLAIADGEAKDQARARLQEIIVNGLNFGAAEAEKSLQGAGKIEIKNAIEQRAIEYVKLHGADTLKSLGAKEWSDQLVEVIKARMATAITDPATPTPPALSPPGVPSK